MYYLTIFQSFSLYCSLIIPNMVELRRVELLTSCLQGRRSSQLSYSPINNIKMYCKKYIEK